MKMNRRIAYRNVMERQESDFKVITESEDDKVGYVREQWLRDAKSEAALD